MKRLITSLLVSLGLVFTTAGSVLANHFWELRMSDPTSAAQARSFNIEYVSLSSDSTDQLTVKLFENGNEKATHITDPGGDSGVFNVSVPTDGTYSYFLRASSSVDGDQKTTTTKTVSVVTPASGPSVITVVQAPAQTGGDAAGAGAAGGTGVAGSQTGAAAGDATTPDDGTVDDQAASTTDGGTEGDVLASETVKKTASDWWPIALAIVVALGVGYYFFQRSGRKE